MRFHPTTKLISGDFEAQNRLHVYTIITGFEAAYNSANHTTITTKINQHGKPVRGLLK